MNKKYVKIVVYDLILSQCKHIFESEEDIGTSNANELGEVKSISLWIVEVESLKGSISTP